MANKEEHKKIQLQVSAFLKQNPNLKKAIDIFGMGLKEYSKAISGLTKKNIIITSTNTNGDVGRD